MPKNADISKVKQRFYAKALFPGVFGAIDCMHVQGHRQKNFQRGKRKKKVEK